MINESFAFTIPKLKGGFERRPPGDSFACSEDGRIYAICDGHSDKYDAMSSRTTADYSVKEMEKFLDKNPTAEGDELCHQMRELVCHIDKNLENLIKCAGATTLDLLVFQNNQAYLQHVGDGETFLYDNQNLQLWVGEEMNHGNELFRMCSSDSGPKIFMGQNFQPHRLPPVQIKLLSEGAAVCMITDGVYYRLSRNTMKNILTDSSSSDEAKRRLISEIKNSPEYYGGCIDSWRPIFKDPELEEEYQLLQKKGIVRARETMLEKHERVREIAKKEILNTERDDATFVYAVQPKKKMVIINKGIPNKTLEDELSKIQTVLEELQTQYNLTSKEVLETTKNLNQAAQDMVTKYDTLNQKLDGAISKLDQPPTDVQELSARVQALEKYLSTPPINIDPPGQLRDETQAIVDQFSETYSTINSDLQKTLGTIQEKINELKSERTSLSEDLEKYRTEKNTVETNLAAFTTELTSARKELAETRKSYETLKPQFSTKADLEAAVKKSVEKSLANINNGIEAIGEKINNYDPSTSSFAGNIHQRLLDLEVQQGYDDTKIKTELKHITEGQEELQAKTEKIDNLLDEEVADSFATRINARLLETENREIPIYDDSSLKSQLQEITRKQEELGKQNLFGGSLSDEDDPSSYTSKIMEKFEGLHDRINGLRTEWGIDISSAISPLQAIQGTIMADVNNIKTELSDVRTELDKIKTNTYTPDKITEDMKKEVKNSGEEIKPGVYINGVDKENVKSIVDEAMESYREIINRIENQVMNANMVAADSKSKADDAYAKAEVADTRSATFDISVASLENELNTFRTNPVFRWSEKIGNKYQVIKDGFHNLTIAKKVSVGIAGLGLISALLLGVSKIPENNTYYQTIVNKSYTLHPELRDIMAGYADMQAQSVLLHQEQNELLEGIWSRDIFRPPIEGSNARIDALPTELDQLNDSYLVHGPRVEVEMEKPAIKQPNVQNKVSQPEVVSRSLPSSECLQLHYSISQMDFQRVRSIGKGRLFDNICINYEESDINHNRKVTYDSIVGGRK
jgi:serine/threonine protein phosphatase PrpC/predicted nuclease with TOPRIM domain